MHTFLKIMLAITTFFSCSTQQASQQKEQKEFEMTSMAETHIRPLSLRTAIREGNVPAILDHIEQEIISPPNTPYPDKCYRLALQKNFTLNYLNDHPETIEPMLAFLDHNPQNQPGGFGPDNRSRLGLALLVFRDRPNFLPICTKLIEQAHDVNHVNARKNTPAILASTYFTTMGTTLLKHLKESGANLNFKALYPTGFGIPLSGAMESKNLNSVKLLVESGVKHRKTVLEYTKRIMTQTECSQERQKYQEIADYLEQDLAQRPE